MDSYKYDPIPNEIADGLIAIAIASAGMGEPETKFRSTALCVTTSSMVLRLAADRIHFFAPESMPTVEADRYDRMIKVVGGDPVAKQLENILRAREWLTRLADALDA